MSVHWEQEGMFAQFVREHQSLLNTHATEFFLPDWIFSCTLDMSQCGTIV